MWMMAEKPKGQGPLKNDFNVVLQDDMHFKNHSDYPAKRKFCAKKLTVVE